MKQFSFLESLAIIVLIIGGLNWGLVGLFNFNFVDYLFGRVSLLSMTVYGIVAIAAVYTVYTLLKGSDSDNEPAV